jgi:predicted nucleic acid-binding protein
VSRNAERSLYLDSSALVKLVVTEPESTALRAYLAGHPTLVSCTLARVEVVRAVARHGSHAVRTARALLDEVDLSQLDDELLDFAAELDGPVRSLDAVHLAAALELGEELDSLVTYDVQMSRAAESLGVAAVAPA